MIHGFTNQRCPRCGGNIYIEMDCYLEGGLSSWYEQKSCLQCGHIICDLAGSLEATRVTSVVDRAISPKKEPLLV